MEHLVEAQHAAPAFSEIDLIHAAGALLDAPIRCQRQTEELQQQYAVHVIVAHEHDRVLGIAREHQPRSVGGSGGKVLQ